VKSENIVAVLVTSTETNEQAPPRRAPLRRCARACIL